MRAWFGLLLATTGCLSASIEADVRRVRALTGIEQLARVEDAAVDPAAEADARRLLEAPLDADRAVQVALLSNRELRASLRELGIARGNMIQAGLLPNLTVEAELLPERNTQLELRVEYDLTRALLAPLRRRAAEPELEAARYQAAGRVVELGYRVRTAVYELQSVEQRLAVAQQVLDGYAAGRDAAAAMLEAGNIPALEWANEDAAYQRARIRVAELELERATAREQVQRMLGTHGADTEWKLTGALPAVPEQPPRLTKLETRVLETNLELKENQHRLEGLARRAGVTRTAGRLPDISIDVHGLQGNPEDSANTSASRDWRFGGGLSVGLPIFDRGQGTATALDAQLDAELERFYGLAVDLRSSAREAKSRVLSAHARARHYRDLILPAQRRVSEQTLLMYNAMQIGIFALLEARREELDAALAEIETTREYWSAVAELNALLAGQRVGAEPNAPRENTADTAARGH